MPRDPVLTREISPLPPRDSDAHKGSVGRIVVIGGCCGDVMMAGAPALVANAALRSGAGLVQMFVPQGLRTAVACLAPCATLRTLPADCEGLTRAVDAFDADVVALGPGLGDTWPPALLSEFLQRVDRPIVIDADGLNLLVESPPLDRDGSLATVMTPHPGEARRLLAARDRNVKFDTSCESRREVARALVNEYGGVVVLKGRGTIVTDGNRLFVNETGNAGMATAGTGDVLTGVIAALIGQRMDPLEATILGVYLHGLAGDFAAEELGRRSTVATDLIDYLPEAFADHEASGQE